MIFDDVLLPLVLLGLAYALLFSAAQSSESEAETSPGHQPLSETDNALLNTRTGRELGP